MRAVPLTLSTLLLGSAFILFVESFAADRPATAGSKSFDPWSPERKFCGRLTIHITGAGKVLPKSDESPSPGDENIFQKYTQANLEQFSKSETDGLPALSILISSDPYLKNQAQRLGINESNIVPASIDSFQEFLSNDGKLSVLERAIQKFSQSAACKELKKNPEDSVLRFLKTEIVVETEHAPSGIPIWSSKTQDGTIDEWAEQHEPKVLDKELLWKLRARLGESAVQTFVEACQGADIGRFLQATDQCSCYLSMTDSASLLSVPIKRSSGFSPAMGAAVNRHAGAKHFGSPNMASMIPKIFSIFDKYTVAMADHSGLSSIFTAGNRANPLHSFVYTSADERVENLLNKFAEQGLENELPKQLLDAGFMADVNKAIKTQSDGYGNKSQQDPQLNRVLAAVNTIRNQNLPYTKDIKEAPIQSHFSEFMIKFRNCATLKNPEPPVCNAISSLIDIAARGTGGGGQRTDEDTAIIHDGNNFFRDFDRSNTTDLIAKYRNEKGEVDLAGLFKKLNSLSQSFEKFRQHLSDYAQNYYNGQLPSDLTPALYEMRDNFRKALFQVQQQFFPLLRKEALEVRLARIEEAAKLLSLHESDFPPGEAKEELRQLANDLACQTLYPVGPAFDRIKNNSLPPLPDAKTISQN